MICTKHDLEMSYFQMMRGKILLKLYTYNVRLPVSQRIANWYHDIFSKFYDHFAPFEVPKYYEIIDMLVDEYITKDSKVLDICCGTGNITFAAARKAKEVIGLDASNGMLSKARNKAQRKALTNVRFIYGDVRERFNFTGGSFDIVTAGFSVPTNVPLFQGKNKNIVAEVYRILKSNGSLILLEGLHEITDIYLSKEQYDDLLTETGFDDIEMKTINDLYGIVCAKKS